MARTFHYLEAPGELSAPLQWFRDLPEPPIEVLRPDELILWFDKLGGLETTPDGKVDASLSPLVSLHLPSVRRGVLWTAGQVQFLTKRMAKSGLAVAGIQRRFERWISANPLIAGHSMSERSTWEYYLEGVNWGFAECVFALPTGLQAVEKGQYFVNAEDCEAILDKVCKKLRLRGVSCC